MVDIQTSNEIVSLRSERNKAFDLGNGKRGLVCHCKPIHYKNDQGGWEDIVVDLRDEGDKFLTDTNKVSVGFRKNKKLHKYFGLRYDYDHQFEGTYLSIQLDGKEQIESDEVISLAKESNDEIKHQLNSGIELIGRVNEVGVKNFVKVNSPVENFKTTEEIHLKGLTCSNKKEGSYYVPDKHDKFNFVDEKDELAFWINLPFFEDNLGRKSRNLTHSLEEIDGRLIYTKTPTKEGQDDLLLAQYPILIDTSPYYSTTADGHIQGGNDVWDTGHDAETGLYLNNNDETAIRTLYYSKADPDYGIHRSFFYFDTSDLPDTCTVTVATLSLYGQAAGAGSPNFSAQEGTQAATLTTADYDACNPTPATGGGEYGHVAWVTEQYNSISFNALGKGNVNKTGTTKICCREYDHDYLDVVEDDDHTAGCYFAEEAGTTKDPKLEIEYESAGEGIASLRQLIGTGQGTR